MLGRLGPPRFGSFEPLLPLCLASQLHLFGSGQSTGTTDDDVAWRLLRGSDRSVLRGCRRNKAESARDQCGSGQRGTSDRATIPDTYLLPCIGKQSHPLRFAHAVEVMHMLVAALAE